MEPQQLAFEVTEGVIANICKELGSDAKEHICLDKLRDSVKFWMENSCSVPEAIEAISPPLQRDVLGKLEEKDIGIKKIMDELEKSSEPMIVEQIRKNLEKDTEHLQSIPGPGKSDSGASESNATTQQESVSADKVSDIDSKTSTSDCVDGDLLQDTRNKVESDDDDDDVVILSTVPRKLAPLILLTDDSSDSPSPSTSNDGVFVMKGTECQENPKPNTSIAEQDTVDLDMATDITSQQKLITDQEVDLKDVENNGFTKKSLANLHKDEMTLNERINEIKNEEQRNIDNIKGEIDYLNNVLQRNDQLEMDMLQQASADTVDAAGSHDTEQTNKPLLPGNLQHHSLNPSAEAKLNLSIDENSSSTDSGDSVNMLVNDHPEGVQSRELREDVHYIRSLLPYFSFKDVYQTLVDNIHHPDRRAFVLEAYINLAVDRQESVQDDVFQGLWAAKKRSHGEVTDPRSVIPKKRRMEFIPETPNRLNEQPMNAPHEVLPSTSMAGFAPVLATGFTHGPIEPRVIDPIWEKWYKEKMDFLCAVVQVDKDLLWGQVLSCQTDADVEALMERIMEEQDQTRKTAPVVPQYVHNLPSTSTTQSVTVAGPNYVLGTIHNSKKIAVPSNAPGTSDDGTRIAGPSNVLGTSDNGTRLAGPSNAPGTSDIGTRLAGPSNAPGTSDIGTRLAGPSNAPGTSDNGTRIAGPSNVPGTSDNGTRDEAVAGPSNEEGTDGGQPVDPEDKILTQVKTLSEMFADADPDYLQERCVANNGDDAKFQEVVDELLKQKDYPKIEEYRKRQKRLEIKKKFIEGMTVEEFLGYFEDPEKVFSDTTTNMSVTYKENARTQLQKDLPYHLSRDIEGALKKHNYHYLPSLRALQENKKLTRRKTKRTSNLKERDLDDVFIKELCYARMQGEIKEHIWKKEENKRRAFLLAKSANELQECRCCYDDEVLEEDMEPCTSQNTLHKFCVNCIRRFVEEEIGQGRTSFRCLEGECKDVFSLTTLQKVMKPSIFSKILERKQLEEIAAAEIEDLVACPFCNFQTIMPNPEDKVFKCLNPECMKDSCRYCKEPNHVPLHCEEVEKQHQKDTRVFLENKMTEAMVRVCWKCKKRFIKEDGCNKMVCPCGAMMCYICKSPIKGYDHFDGNHTPTDSRKCPLWSNSKVIHAEEVRAEASKLQKGLDPNVDLLHNPLQDLPEVPQHLIKHRAGQPVQLPHAPPAHQQQIQAHPAVVYHGHPHVAHVVHQNPAAFHLPPPPPPPAHRQLPPAPPAHRQFPQVMQIGVMRPPTGMDMPEANRFQHQHHHHHIHPARPPPVHLPPTQALRENVMVNEFLMEFRRNHEMQMRLWNRFMEHTNNSSSSSTSRANRD